MMSTAAASAKQSVSSGKSMNIALWVVQILLAFAFGMAGFVKVSTPTEVLAQNMSWVSAFPEWMRFVIGGSELAGAIGLILPAALRVLPVLTPAAAGGLLTVMVLAAGYHGTHEEMGVIPVTIVLGGLAAFVLWGRLKKAPIHARR